MKIKNRKEMYKMIQLYLINRDKYAVLIHEEIMGKNSNKITIYDKTTFKELKNASSYTRAPRDLIVMAEAVGIGILNAEEITGTEADKIFDKLNIPENSRISNEKQPKTNSFIIRKNKNCYIIYDINKNKIYGYFDTAEETLNYLAKLSLDLNGIMFSYNVCSN